jgi:fructose-1,6-bisphosphatase/inositol monophosphatase family enzyme
MDTESRKQELILSDLFIHIFRLAAQQAGHLALRLQGEVRLEHKTGANSPESAALTSVDLAIQDVVLHLLLHRLGGAALDAEEETELTGLFPAHAPGRPLIVLDPVDGTLNYAENSQDYAIMGALLLDGLYLASVIHFPAWGRTYWAQRDVGAWLQTHREAPRQIGIEEAPATVLIPPKSFQPAKDSLQGSGYSAVQSRCSAVDATAPVSGRGCGSLSLVPLDRRRAIGFLITAEAGGSVLLAGQPWAGQDPETLSKSSAPAVVADSIETAARLSSLLDCAA